MRLWVVKDGDAKTVGAIVLRAGGDARAIDEGRVFLGRKRVLHENESVRIGDEIKIADPESSGSDAIAITIAILAREPDFVAVDKPAGLPTIADHGGRAHALVARAAAALAIPEARLHPTSRLDRDVGGVVLFALTPEAADRLKRARETHDYRRRYVAIASRAPSRPGAAREGTWDAPIGIAKDPRHRAINGKDAIAARTHFAVVAEAGAYVLLALAPITGRTHQLRLHASHAGAPLLGDRVYGAPPRITLPSGKIVPLDRIALHAARVTVPRASSASSASSPISSPTRAPLAIDSPIPRALRDLWLSLGGDDSAWDTAVSWTLPNE